MRKSDFTLPTLDDLFSTQAERDDAKLERVRNIPLAELHPFKGHPFKVQNNEEMQRMIESIRKVGAITPALARPLPDGGYELISGHRRLAACQVLGVETMPVIVGNEFVKMIFVSFLNSNIYLLKKRLTSRVGIFLETPYSKASSHFPIASH